MARCGVNRGLAPVRRGGAEAKPDPLPSKLVSEDHELGWTWRRDAEPDDQDAAVVIGLRRRNP